MFEFNEKNWPEWSMYFTHDASSPQHLTDHREHGNFYCLLSIGGSDVCVCVIHYEPHSFLRQLCVLMCVMSVTDSETTQRCFNTDMVCVFGHDFICDSP